jgi:hypothetical protein
MDEFEVLRNLADTLPGSSKRWAAVVAERDIADLPYVAGGALARLALDEGSRDPESLRPFFAEIERVVQNPAARNLVVVGVLEALQNLMVSSPEGCEALRISIGTLLPSETSRLWRALEDVWAGHISGEQLNMLVDGLG